MKRLFLALSLLLCPQAKPVNINQLGGLVCATAVTTSSLYVIQRLINEGPDMPFLIKLQRNTVPIAFLAASITAYSLWPRPTEGSWLAKCCLMLTMLHCSPR